MEPVPPYTEVYMRPPGYREARVQTCERDSAGRWWHKLGGEVVREATTIERIGAIFGLFPDLAL